MTISGAAPTNPSTGITQGLTPFTVAGTGGESARASAPDPRASSGSFSTRVQIQNPSDCSLFVYIGTSIFIISAMQSTTLPLIGDGNSVDYVAYNQTTTTATVALILCWLIKDEVPPQPDGPLTGPSAGTSGGGGEVNYALEAGGNLAALLAALDSVIYTPGVSKGTELALGLMGFYHGVDPLPLLTAVDGTLLTDALVAGASAPGAVVPTSTIVVAGSDGVHSQFLSVDTSGRLILSPSSGTIAADVTITSPLDGSGNVKTDLELVAGAAPNLAKETGGALAALETLFGTTIYDANIPGILVGPADPATGDTFTGRWGVDNPAAATLIAGHDGTPVMRALLTDAAGQLKVLVEGGTLPAPAAPSNTSSISASSLSVKGSAGTLYGITGYSSIAQYVQLLDATSLSSGVTVPVVVIYLLTAGSFALDYGSLGRAFATGIYAAFSSTEAVFTTGTAGTLDCQYV